MPEVLLTLSIIGVLAALTIPAIIIKAQEKALDEAFKKEFSQLSNAIIQTNYEQNEDWGLFWQSLDKKLNIVKKCTGCLRQYRGIDEVAKDNPDGNSYGNDLGKNCSRYFKSQLLNAEVKFLADGSTIVAYRYDNAMWAAYFLLDTNGEKGPNKWGHDIFGIRITENNLIQGCFIKDKGGKSQNEILGGG